MTTARPFAYSPGTGITGTTQVGSLVVGTPTDGFTFTPRFWNGPDEELGYVIAHPVPSANQPNPVPGATAALGFNRTKNFNDSSFISLAEYVSRRYAGNPQTFSTASQASSWLTTNGYWNSYGLTPSVSLIMSLDSTLGVSGSSWYDQSGVGNNATLYGGYGTTGYSGSQVLTLNGSSGYVFPTGGFGTNLDTGFSYEVWAYPTKTANGTLLAEWSGAPPTGWNDTQMAFVSGKINAGVFPDNFFPSAYLTGPTFSNTTWYNIVMTYDNSSGDLKLYINGSLSGTTNGTKSNPPSTYLTLGRPDTANSYIGGATGYFEGYIGSWNIWDGPLSATSVLLNYNSTKSRYAAQLVTTGLVINLDANNSSSYPGTGDSIFNLQSGSYTHTKVNAPYTILNGVKCFDCNGASTVIGVTQGTGPTLPSTGYTYVTWARVRTSSSSWRTLFRTYPSDHPILVQTGTDNLGFYDNNTASFIDSGYDVTSIEDVWVQYSVIGDSSSSIFYINGTQVGTTAYGAGGNTHWAWGSIDGQPFGYVANMFYYNRKLSPSEIQQNYNFLSPRF